MRAISGVLLAIGFVVLSFAMLQLAVNLLDRGDNLKIWLISAGAGGMVAFLGLVVRARQDT